MSSVPPLEECHFYHTIELPGYGEIPGMFDLRATTDTYLGGIPLDGRRVLEVGPASGYLTFYMESQGAEVVALELPAGDEWDIVPYATADLVTYRQRRRRLQRRIRNSFLFAHHTLNSKAKVAFGTVYAPPENLGTFDLCTFGMVLLHVRDPFRALQSILPLVDEVVITEFYPWWTCLPPELQEQFCTGQGATPPTDLENGLVKPELAARLSEAPPLLFFAPQPETGDPKDTWHFMTPATIQRYLGVLGFRTERVTYHFQFSNTSTHASSDDRIPQKTHHACFTVVGKRVSHSTRAGG